VQLTEANVAFAIEEIIPSTLSEEDLAIELFKLTTNPISNHLVFNSNSTHNNNNLRITDMTGKVVMQLNNVIIENNTKFPITLANGIYVLRVNNNQGLDYTQKVIVSQ
jgi:hypothetical protein